MYYYVKLIQLRNIVVGISIVHNVEAHYLEQS